MLRFRVKFFITIAILCFNITYCLHLCR